MDSVSTPISEVEPYDTPIILEPYQSPLPAEIDPNMQLHLSPSDRIAELEKQVRSLKTLIKRDQEERDRRSYEFAQLELELMLKRGRVALLTQEIANYEARLARKDEEIDRQRTYLQHFRDSLQRICGSLVPELTHLEQTAHDIAQTSDFVLQDPKPQSMEDSFPD